MDRDRWHRPMFQERDLKLWVGRWYWMPETVPFDARKQYLLTSTYLNHLKDAF